jgi:hypothetical protein
VGERPVYSFGITVGDTVVSDFNGGKAAVEIPYVLAAGENPNAVVIFYLNETTGRLEIVRGHYADGTVTFVTGHFSKYVIEYVELAFTDIKDQWYETPAIFVGARAFIPGIDQDSALFAGNTKLTREEFLASIMNAYGIEIDPEATDNFDDVDKDSPYAGYIATAKALGITKGIGDNRFGLGEITREQMFVFLYRVLDEINELPRRTEGSPALDDFDDADEISYWAESEIKRLLEGGLIEGMGNDILAPHGDAERSHMARLIWSLLTK